MNYGSTLKVIRKNKGYSQQYLAKNILSQSSFSKFEHNQCDINFVAFHQLLEKLNMTYNEFSFIHEGFQNAKKTQLVQDFFSMPYNSKEELKRMLMAIDEYLQYNEDLLLEDLRLVCLALLHLRENLGMENARKLVTPIWTRMSALHNWYITDFRLLNSILYFFPTDIAIEISNNMLQRLKKYKKFEEVKNLKLTLCINLSLLLIKNKQYKEALQILNKLLNENLKIMPYQSLAVCLSRKEICLQKLLPSNETPYLSKAIELVKIYNDDSLLQTITLEFGQYIH
ncbi:hypothetical protein [Metasolibacillus sp. FSL K6-0083]|uniref:helix-turn-helix domain-containing protein n=1 Tax=Metasolibacillus sp. FSL K6-0083 TaxID=2921416 RepID=UPI00315B2C9C